MHDDKVNRPLSIRLATGIGIGSGLTSALFVIAVGLLVEKVFTPKSSGSGGTNYPIKVRGGSMTVFTRANGQDSLNVGWQQMPDKSWCTSVDNSVISYKGSPLNIKVQVPWTIDIYGHVPKFNGSQHRGDASSNGIELSSQVGDCGSIASGTPNASTSVRLVPFGKNGSFYPSDLLDASDETGNKRFRDKSADCQGEPDDPSGKGDRDYCERIAEVDVFLAAPPTHAPVDQSTTPSNWSKTCTNGDCSVEIGKE